MNKKDLSGKRFGKLVVLEETDQRKYGRVVWKCRCDCGNISLVISTSIGYPQTQAVILVCTAKEISG